MAEIDTLVGEVASAVSLAVGAYGAGVLTRAEDAAADSTVRLGQRLLARMLHRPTSTEHIRSAVVDLVRAPDDPDVLETLRLHIKAIFADDPQLRAEVASMLPGASDSRAVGTHSVAVTGDNRGIISTGHSAINIQGL